MSNIFKIATDTDPDKKNIHLLGFYAEKDHDTLITLSALYRKTSKSLLLREILADWANSNGASVRTWTDLIGERAYHIWCGTYKSSTHYLHVLAEYRKALKQDLKTRHLSDEIVDGILIKFDEQVDKEADS